MKLYKLTDQNYKTRNDTIWGVGVTYTASNGEPKLCTNTVIHAYKSVEQALLLNPIHVNIPNPVVWAAEGEIIIEDFSKVGCKSLTTTSLLQIPRWYKHIETRKRVQVMFAILCAESVLHYWIDEYPNDDRPQTAIAAAKTWFNKNTYDAAATDAAAIGAAAAAAAAARAATDTADAAVAARTATAARAAHAAAAAAAAAADAAAAARTATAARAACAAAAAYAARAVDAARAADATAARAAYAATAAYAADYAVYDCAKIDFNKLAKKAVKNINEMLWED